MKRIINGTVLGSQKSEYDWKISMSRSLIVNNIRLSHAEKYDMLEANVHPER